VAQCLVERALGGLAACTWATGCVLPAQRRPQQDLEPVAQHQQQVGLQLLQCLAEADESSPMDVAMPTPCPNSAAFPPCDRSQSRRARSPARSAELRRQCIPVATSCSSSPGPYECPPSPSAAGVLARLPVTTQILRLTDRRAHNSINSSATKLARRPAAEHLVKAHRRQPVPGRLTARLAALNGSPGESRMLHQRLRATARFGSSLALDA